MAIFYCYVSSQEGILFMAHFSHDHLGIFPGKSLPPPIGRPHRFRLAPIHSAGSPLCGGAQTAPLGRPDGKCWVCGRSVGNLWEIYGKCWENVGKMDLWEIYGKSIEHVGNIWNICGKPMEIYWKMVAIIHWTRFRPGPPPCMEDISMEHVGKMALQPSPPA